MTTKSLALHADFVSIVRVSLSKSNFINAMCLTVKADSLLSYLVKNQAEHTEE